MKLTAIVAVDNNWAIGSKTGLLYTLPEDLKHFKNTTLNHIIVMGINTLKTLPHSKPLPKRITVCIDSAGTSRDDCHVVKSTEECLDLLKLMTDNDPNAEVFICGGAYTYKSFLDITDKVIVTKVDAISPEATVYFPNLDADENFFVKSVGPVVEDNGYSTRIWTYTKVKNNDGE